MEIMMATIRVGDKLKTDEQSYQNLKNGELRENQGLGTSLENFRHRNATSVTKRYQQRTSSPNYSTV